MAWKKIIVGSGAAGAVTPSDLTTIGGHNIDGYYLGVHNSAADLSWQLDQQYTHPQYTTSSINIASGTLSGPQVISSLDVGLVTNNIGSVTSTTGTIGYRNLTLADLGYTGDTDAINYTHNTYDGDDISINTGTLTGATIIESITVDFQTDTEGHIQVAEGAATTRELSRSDLGYTGHADADKYTAWTMNIANNAGTITETTEVHSADDVVLKAGQNCSWTTNYAGNTLTATLNAVADYVGHITEVEDGFGMDFSHLDVDTPAGPISMGTPSTVGLGTSPTANSFLQGVDGIAATTYSNATSHTHAITAYSDSTSNYGHLLMSNATGGLILKDLEVTDSLVVQGSEIVLGSDNLTIEDNELQINWDTSLNAGAGGYTSDDSTIIMGHSDITKGTKIINTDTAMKITDIPGAEPAGGSVSPGVARAVEMGDVECEVITATSFNGSGDSVVSGACQIGSYLGLGSMANAPANETGRMYFDGSDFWINL